jgi:hypothetical protein
MVANGIMLRSAARTLLLLKNQNAVCARACTVTGVKVIALSQRIGGDAEVELHRL